MQSQEQFERSVGVKGNPPIFHAQTHAFAEKLRGKKVVADLAAVEGRGELLG
jgi:hypothetical protein